MRKEKSLTSKATTTRRAMGGASLRPVAQRGNSEYSDRHSEEQSDEESLLSASLPYFRRHTTRHQQIQPEPSLSEGYCYQPEELTIEEK